MYLPEFNYVGFGPNNEHEVIEAITGQPAIRVGQSAIMANVELCIQTVQEVPSVPSAPDMPSVRDVLERGWGEFMDFEKFQAYVARAKKGATTRGTPYTLSQEALEAMWNWELTALGWTEPTQVETAVWPGGQSTRLWTPLLKGEQPISKVADGRAYPHFLIPRSVTLKNAKKARLAA